MDYEQKYNKLVNAIKVLQETNPSDEGIQNWVNDNVPELRESEDEKIRKAIINIFATHKDYEVYFGVSVEDIRVWLERQAEQKPIETTWKPSEEQMEALKTSFLYWKGATKEVPCTERLESLYEQLKQL